MQVAGRRLILNFPLECKKALSIRFTMKSLCTKKPPPTPPPPAKEGAGESVGAPKSQGGAGAAPPLGLSTQPPTATQSIRAAVKEQRIEISGQVINYVKVGVGSKNVLCCPGALGTIWSDFTPQIEGLDKSKFTVVVWDPPGYGFSQPPPRNFNSNFYEEDAEAAYNFMMKLGLRKFSLMGWSDGGNSSLILAAKHPDNVEKLVVWGSNSYILPAEVQAYEKIRDVSKWSKSVREPLAALYTEKRLQEMWNSWCDTQIRMGNEGGNVCKHCLEHIKSPTLILHGDKDSMVAPEHPNFLFNNIKDAKLLRFPDGKHNIHLKYAEEFNKVVSEFLLH